MVYNKVKINLNRKGGGNQRMIAVTQYIMFKLLDKEKCIDVDDIVDLIVVKLPIEGDSSESEKEVKNEIDEIIEVYNDITRRTIGWECLSRNENTICVNDGCERSLRHILEKLNDKVPVEVQEILEQE